MNTPDRATGAVFASSANGEIAGQVTAGDLPVAEAVVMIIDGDVPFIDVAAVTDDGGQFLLGGLAPGYYRVQARSGERVITEGVQLGRAESLWLDLQLP